MLAILDVMLCRSVRLQDIPDILAGLMHFVKIQSHQPKQHLTEVYMYKCTGVSVVYLMAD